MESLLPYINTDLLRLSGMPQFDAIAAATTLLPRLVAYDCHTQTMSSSDSYLRARHVFRLEDRHHTMTCIG